jgi:hypothetical protein
MFKFSSSLYSLYGLYFRVHLTTASRVQKTGGERVAARCNLEKVPYEHLHIRFIIVIIAIIICIVWYVKHSNENNETNC